MFKRKNKEKKEKEPKRLDPEKIESIRKVSFDVAGSAAGMCTGLVVKAALEMIPVPPLVKPVVKTGYTVGKWIISGLSTAMVERAVSKQLHETYESASNLITEMKNSELMIKEQLQAYNVGA